MKVLISGKEKKGLSWVELVCSNCTILDYHKMIDLFRASSNLSMSNWEKSCIDDDNEYYLNASSDITNIDNNNFTIRVTEPTKHYTKERILMIVKRYLMEQNIKF